MTTKEKSLSPEDGGKVYYVKTTKGLFPLSSLLKAASNKKKVKTQQLRSKRWLSERSLVPHPFSTTGLLYLEENSCYFDACVRQIAEDVVGQGWELKAKEGREGASKQDQERAIDFLTDPNETDEDIGDIIKKAVIDWGSIGWWALETEKDPPIDGRLIGLWHLPAHTVWVHKSKDKYAQIREGERVWFSRYGSGLRISSKTGNEIKGSENIAHELIFQVEYYQRSDYYGRPNILSAIGSVIGLIGVRDFNLAFFENYGVPTQLIILKGRWSAAAARQITNFLDVEVRGTSNAHKTLVLKPPAEGEVEVKPLATEIKEASFRFYQKMLRDEILSAYRMPPYRIGIAETGSLGGSTAAEATKIYVSSIIEPLKRLTGRIITNKLIRDGLGVNDYTFEWKKLDTRDQDALVKRLQLQFMMGSVNPNEVRRELGREPRKDPEAEQYYVAANYVAIGSEELEKREATVMNTLEQLAAQIQGLSEADQKTRETFDRILSEEEL